MKTLLSALLVTLALSAQAQITSTFDIDADGWLFYNASNVSNAVNFNSTSGNPGGYVSATYPSNQNAGFQFWLAPSKFHGNHLALSLGLKFKFDLQQSVAGTGANFDVRIKNGSASIYISGLTPKPAVAPAWTSYSFALDETGGWFYSAGAVVATRSQIMGILTNVTSIEIRGTYASNASYTSGLDNVILEQRILTPAPVASSLSATSGKPGDVITITGSGFNATASSNVVSFGAYAGTKAVVQSATATQLQVVVPPGAVYGPITITNTVTGLTSKTSTPFNPLFDGGGRIIPASFKNQFFFSVIDIEGFFVGDVDGDGWEDFGVANNNADNAIDIYRNLGLGGTLSTSSFAAKVSFAIPPLAGGGTNGAGLWFADLDGDGKLDAISSNKMFVFGAAGFVTLRNISTPGNIAFEAPEYWVGGSDETPISLVADLDGDGRPEMLAGEGALGSTAFSYFWINQNLSTPGNIEFGAPIYPFNGTVVNGFAGASAGDLNGDGKNELIISGFNQGQSFAVLQNVSTPGVPAFQNAFTILTNQYFGYSHVVDMNLDGKNDLVYKISGETSVHIRLNSDTDGALTAADFVSDIIVAGDLSNYGGISISDINGDGKPDILASDNGDMGVYENVFAGGVFDANAFVPAYQYQGNGNGTYPYSPVAADFNHDGKPDIIMGITNTSPDRVSIFENKNVHAPYISLNTVSPLSAPIGSTVAITGNNFSTVLTDNEVWFGAVRATVLTATPTQLTVNVPPGATYAPVSVRKGELTSSYHLPFRTTFSSGVNFNNTHFAPPTSFTLSGAAYNIEIMDLDRDGKPDIAAQGGSFLTYFFRNTHSIGSIAASSLTAAGLTSNSAGNPKVVDCDGDGLADIVSPNGRAYQNTSTSGTISFSTDISLSLGASYMDFADLNRDGKTDLLITNSGGSAQLLLKENRSKVGILDPNTTYGSFSGNVVYGKPSTDGVVLAADFDNDGFPDAVTTNPITDNISIYHNGGKFRVSNTSFDTRVEIAVGDIPNRIYSGDFDADGKVDLLLYHGGTSSTLLIVFQNTSSVGSISFNRIDLINPSATTVATVADLDGDGKPEILTTSEAGNRFSIFKNLHTSGTLTAASFAAPFNTTVTAPRGITTGDLNLDGKPEIIITRAANLLVVYENLIPSIPPPTITSFTPTSGPVGITVTISGTNFDTAPANNIVKFNGTTSVVTASTATSITTTVPVGATTGPISVTVGTGTGVSTTNFTVTASPVITIITQPSNFSACFGQTPIVTFTTAATGTTTITYQWQLQKIDFTFDDVVDGGAYSGANTPTLTVNTSVGPVSPAYRCIINGDFASQQISNTASLLTVFPPLAPSTTGANRCGTGSITLTASGGTNGQYKWYTVASGGTAIAGEVNSSYITPSLSSTSSYFVSLSVSSCESSRTSVTATINPLPNAPTATGASACLPSASITLNASGGTNGQYRWYTVPTSGTAIAGQTSSSFTTPTLSATTTYYVSIDNGTCESGRTSVVASLLSCTTPPAITTASLSTSIGGIAELNLLPLISTINNPLNISSIAVTVQPPSGAVASVSGGKLNVDYKNISFSGKESITIRACDTNGNCAEQVFEIEVGGDVKVYNAVSPDGKNPILRLEFIDTLSPKNQVSIYNRWGDEVFSISDYDNKARVFAGLGNGGSKLPAGTYFYKINLSSTGKTMTGFLALKY
jgi:hypothetical protein